MKTPVTYYGGKQNLSKRIVELLPSHDCYVEPFAGGAAVLFAKPISRIEVINDRDKRLVNFYRVLRDPILGPALVEQIELTPYSRSEYADTKIEAETYNTNPLNAARAYYTHLMQAFGSDYTGGWRSGKSVPNRTCAVWRNKLPLLEAAIERLSNVMIENDDAIKIIKRYDSTRTVFYVDPPYVNYNQGHYAGYTQTDLDQLISALDTCQGSFVLSGYENDAYPKHWERLEISCKSSASKDSGKGRERTEILLTMNRSEDQ